MTQETETWQPSHSPWFTAIAVILTTFMASLDISVVNVSLRHIAGTFSASVEETTWILTSYLVSSVIVLSCSSWIARYFGRKRYLAFSAAAFIAASALCGLAWNLPVLIFARILQGLAAGGFSPQAQAIILETFPAKDREMGMATYAMGVVFAPVIGPTLGGWITDNYSWRWLFYINIPMGLIGLFLQEMFIEDPPHMQSGQIAKIDAVGLCLLSSAIGLLQLILDRGQEMDWFASRWIIWGTALDVILIGAVILWELEQKEPIANLTLFKDLNFATGSFLIMVSNAILVSSTVALPIFMQGLLRYTATDAGIALMPRGIFTIISIYVAGQLMKHFDGRALVMLGFLINAFAWWLFSQINLEITRSGLAWLMGLYGLCLGFGNVTLLILSTRTIAHNQYNQATSLYNLFRHLGGSIGISVMITALTRGAQTHHVHLAAGRLSPYDLSLIDHAQTLGEIATGRSVFYSSFITSLTTARGLVLKELGRQAKLLAFIDLFRSLTVICIFCAALVMLFRFRRKDA